jgi:arylsulfatase A-like enzyme
VLASAPASKPIFAVFASTAPHNEGGRYLPRTSPLYEGDARCAGAGTWSPPSYNEADLSDKPAYIQGLTPLPFASGWPLRKACEQLLSVGDTVRNLKQELARQGRLRNTVFVLMSDNGMGWGEHRIPFKNAPYTTPLALWITWPSGRGTAPRDEGGLVSMIDLGVTLASVGGADMPWADGLDLSALLMDAQPPITRDDMLHSLPDGHHAPGLGLPPMPGWWAVRTTSHLWIEWNDGPRELYDLRGDPWLLRSLHGDPAYGSVRAALKARLDALRSGVPNQEDEASLRRKSARG